MVMYRSRLFLIVLSLVSTHASHVVYECEPGFDPDECSIWNMEYKKDQQPQPVINISESVKKIRVYCELFYNRIRRYGIYSYDDTLHSKIFGNPTHVAINGNTINTLHIPYNLQRGAFKGNSIKQLLTNSSERYALIYLDLSNNNIANISTLSVLVQLQTLNLYNNHLESFEPSTFVKMVNLTLLYLGNNNLASMDLKLIPRSLTELWLNENRFTELNLTGVTLPALRLLDVEENLLRTFDMTVLFAAFPALRIFSIAYNPFPRKEALRIIGELSRHNKSAHGGPLLDGDCHRSEYMLEGLCFVENEMTGALLWKAFVLSVGSLILLAVTVATGRWIWYQMRY